MANSPISVINYLTDDTDDDDNDNDDNSEEILYDKNNCESLNDLSKMRCKLNLLEGMIYNDSFYLKKTIVDDISKNNLTDDEEIMINNIKERIDHLENTVSVLIKKKQCQNRLDYLEPLIISLLQNDLFKEN